MRRTRRTTAPASPSVMFRVVLEKMSLRTARRLTKGSVGDDSPASSGTGLGSSPRVPVGITAYRWERRKRIKGDAREPEDSSLEPLQEQSIVLAVRLDLRQDAVDGR